jgi:hypothetical protein
MHQEVTREIERLLPIIFAGLRETGELDPEAVAMGL